MPAKEVDPDHEPKKSRKKKGAASADDNGVSAPGHHRSAAPANGVAEEHASAQRNIVKMTPGKPAPGKVAPDIVTPLGAPAERQSERKAEANRKKRQRVKVRAWQIEDIPGVIACHRAAYPEYDENAYYTERYYEMQFAAFPEGQVLAELGGKIIGYATSLIVQLEENAHTYTYEEITGGGTFATHDPSGDTLYGADIGVHRDYRGLGVSVLLYEARKRIMQRYNLRRMVAYGRIPGYNEYAGKMPAEEYVEKVVSGELTDPALRAHLRAGYRVRRVLLDFLWDNSSLNYSTLLEMPNPHYQPQKRKIAAAPLQRVVRKIRICAAQYQMRSIHSWQEFQRTVEFFVDTANTYHSHFLLMPELFTAQLFTLMPADLEPRVAMRQLADMGNRYIEMFQNLAQENGIYIIGGSHPVVREDEVYNVAHLFTPTGQVYTQDALHIPPAERGEFDIEPGDEIKVFDTPLARIAIQVSYDVEFPELARLQTLAGAEVIFIPYSTDERKAYDRLRISAKARAVENFIYTVIAGNVGNLPTTRNYLINYGRAAVFTPSDFAFPPHAIAGESDANVETVLITDLDLTSLAQQRDVASVRHLYDRRLDLYDLRAKRPVKVVRTE